MDFDLTQLRELLAILNQTDIDELCLKSSDFELTIRKGSHPAGAIAQVQAPVVAAVPTVDAVVPVAEPAAPAVPDKNWVDVTAPMVGTFYRSPAPDEPCFVEVGDRVRRGQTVCIIEAMKLMNELEAELTGEIVEILVENGAPIEYGQTLMRINPTS